MSDRTLWMGDLAQYMTEDWITRLFGSLGYHVVVKIIRDRVTHQPAGYGFVEFQRQEDAHHVLEYYDGTEIPNTGGYLFKLNWTGKSQDRQHGGDREQRMRQTSMHSERSTTMRRPPVEQSIPQRPREELHQVFVGDIAQDCTEQMLYAYFSHRYPSLVQARVVTDEAGRNRGFGFLKFASASEAQASIRECNGVMIGSRMIRLQESQRKPADSTMDRMERTDRSQWNVQQSDRTYRDRDFDKSADQAAVASTTVYVGNIDASVNTRLLGDVFSRFGHIVDIRCPQGGNFAFVTFSTHDAAKMAVLSAPTIAIGACMARVNWGRGQAPQQRHHSSAPQPAGNGYGPPEGGMRGPGRVGHDFRANARSMPSVNVPKEAAPHYISLEALPQQYNHPLLYVTEMEMGPEVYPYVEPSIASRCHFSHNVGHGASAVDEEGQAPRTTPLVPLVVPLQSK